MRHPDISPSRRGRSGLRSSARPARSAGKRSRSSIAITERFQIVALAAHHHSTRFQRQIERYRPDLVAVNEGPPGERQDRGEVVCGPDALVAAATHPEVDIVVAATSGHAAIVPTYRGDRRWQNHRARQQGDDRLRRRPDRAVRRTRGASDCVRSTANTAPLWQALQSGRSVGGPPAYPDGLRRTIPLAIEPTELARASPSSKRSRIRPGQWAAKLRSIRRR